MALEGKGRSRILTLKAAVITILFAGFFLVGLSQVIGEADPWLAPVVTDGELEATYWIREHTVKEAKFVAGIFEGELIMGMTTRIPLVGGDWANAPDPVEKMSAVDRIYETESAAEAYRLAVQHHADYIYVPLKRSVHTGFRWVHPNLEKFEDPEYFTRVYENSDVRIYKLRS